MSPQIDNYIHYAGVWFSFVAGSKAVKDSMEYRDITNTKNYSINKYMLKNIGDE